MSPEARNADLQTRSSPHELMERGRVAERAARGREARELYEAALHSLDADSDAGLAVTLTRWIGRTYLADGDTEAADDCSKLSLALAELRDDREGIAQALILLASIAYQGGQLDRAEHLFERARANAEEAGETLLLAHIEMNLGVISNIRGDLQSALKHYHASLAAFRHAKDEEKVGAVLNNLGMLYTDLESWAEAERTLNEAHEVCTRAGNVRTLIMVEANRAEMWLAQREFDRARTACDAALELATRVDDSRAMGELSKHYGVICRETGRLDEAEEHLARSERLAREREDALLAAETSREQAELFRRQGRYKETLLHLNRAHASFTRLRASLDIADVDGRIAKLETTFLDIVRRWGESIESADQYTQGHCMRVADYACALARTIGMEEKTLLWFRMGALLHDVGKIVVPAEVLNKPGALTPEERAIVERHPDAGVELLEGIEFPWDIRPMVRFHHERWDGGGYPCGLKGEEIPLAARILCIADVYDALTSDRPYRAGFSPERALGIMRHQMESHFDPDLLVLWEDLCSRDLAPGVDEEPQHPVARVGSPAGSAPARSGADAGAAPRILLVTGDLREVGLLPADMAGALEVVCTDDLEEAARRLRTEAFDAVLYEIPERTDMGIASLKWICDRAPEVPVLALAAGADDPLTVSAIRGGAQDCLPLEGLQGGALARALRCAIERHRFQTELRARSLIDDLTGLYNRRGFFTIAPQRLHMARQRSRETVLVFADMDGLKQVNDLCGHPEGDRALVEVASLLRSAFDVSDCLARFGGDEFVVLSDGARGSVTALHSRLRKRIDLHNASTARPYPISISIGVATSPAGDTRSLEELLRLADTSMYERKRARRMELARGA